MMTPTLYAHTELNSANTEDLDFLVVQKLQPELYFSGEQIDRLTDAEKTAISDELAKHSLKPTLHAPFCDLNVGASDSKIRDVSLERLIWALDTAAFFNAFQVVLHPGFGQASAEKTFSQWLHFARPALDKLVNHAKTLQLKLAFENIYDSTPNNLLELINAYEPATVGICFDVGHFNLFSQVPMRSWLATLGSRLFEVHLHDNLGTDDDHIALGDGTVKYRALIDFLNTLEPDKYPVLTLEMEQKTHVIKSVNRIRAWFDKAVDSD